MVHVPKFDPLVLAEDDEVIEAFVGNSAMLKRLGGREVFSKIATIDRIKVVNIRKLWNVPPYEKKEIIKWHRDNTGEIGKSYIYWIVESYDANMLDDALYILTYAYKENIAITIEQCYQAIELFIKERMPIQWAIKISTSTKGEQIEEIRKEREKLEEQKQRKLQSIRPTMESLQRKLK